MKSDDDILRQAVKEDEDGILGEDGEAVTDTPSREEWFVSAGFRADRGLESRGLQPETAAA